VAYWSGDGRLAPRILLWDRMKALTEEQVNTALGPWLDAKQICRSPV
jgi:hypothetical protein